MINICDIVLDAFSFGIWGALKTQRQIEEYGRKNDADMRRILTEHYKIKQQMRKEHNEWEEGIGNFYR
jgi:hypothetical protein